MKILNQLVATIVIGYAFLAPALALNASNPSSRIYSTELQEAYAKETFDGNIEPTTTLRRSNYHSVTPLSIPGGKTITTKELAKLIDSDERQVIVDVLGGTDMLSIPTAVSLPSMGYGNIVGGDRSRVKAYLSSVTEGHLDRPLVFLCLSYQCWLSYNAALEAIREGFTNVLWYRGGREAWQEARLPLLKMNAVALPEPEISPKGDAMPDDFFGVWEGRWNATWAVRLTIEKGLFGAIRAKYEWEERIGNSMRSQAFSARIDATNGKMMVGNSINMQIDSKNLSNALLIGEFGQLPRKAFLLKTSSN